MAVSLLSFRARLKGPLPHEAFPEHPVEGPPSSLESLPPSPAPLPSGDSQALMCLELTCLFAVSYLPPALRYRFMSSGTCCCCILST